MQIVCCEAFGPPESLEWIDVDEPVAGPGQLLVDVQAAGVGFVDGLMIQGLYQVKPKLPYFPGSEFAGRVAALGEGVSGWSVGDAVFGSAGGGAFAERMAVPAAACYPVGNGLDMATAAGLYINYATALYGLRDCGRLQPGEHILILGAAGGVGSAAISVARAMGGVVVAGASSEAKLAYARAAGADLTVNYSQPDWRDALKDALRGVPLKLVYDPVGGDLAEPAFRSLSPGGRLLVVGFASGTIPKIALNLALLKQSAIVGVDWGGAARAQPAINRELLGTLLEWIDVGRLKPSLVCVRNMHDVASALDDQLAGRIIGKLVLTR